MNNSAVPGNGIEYRKREMSGRKAAHFLSKTMDDNLFLPGRTD
jgi:hypothetical protein